jgi:hypothetical protein
VTVPFQPSQSADLDGVNLTFHATYDELTTTAAKHGPVFVVFPDALFAFRADAWTEHSLTTSGFHELKGVAHVALALFTIVTKADAIVLRPEIRKSISAVKNAANRASAELAEFPEAARNDALKALRVSIDFADVMLGENVPKDAAAHFARDIGPTLLILTEHATRLQLTRLDEVVTIALSSLQDEERRDLRVIVGGDHQARARNLAMQYFAQRLGESQEAESQLMYAEGVDTPQAALDLLGVQRVDRAIAGAFFGDPKRLQRDVLGDAAAKLLKQAKFSPIRGAASRARE